MIYASLASTYIQIRPILSNHINQKKKKKTFKIASLKSNLNNEIPWVDFVKIKKNKQKN